MRSAVDVFCNHPRFLSLEFVEGGIEQHGWWATYTTTDKKYYGRAFGPDAEATCKLALQEMGVDPPGDAKAWFKEMREAWEAELAESERRFGFALGAQHISFLLDYVRIWRRALAEHDTNLVQRARKITLHKKADLRLRVEAHDARMLCLVAQARGSVMREALAAVEAGARVEDVAAVIAFVRKNNFDVLHPMSSTN